MKVTMANKLNTKVGIFWCVDGIIVSDAVSLKRGEPYGGAVQYGGHYDFHESLEPVNPHEYRLKAHDYDYYPRGRVVFFTIKNCFALYADPCLSVEDIQKVTSLFGLEKQTVEIRGDDHYRCASCNAAYLE